MAASATQSTRTGPTTAAPETPELPETEYMPGGLEATYVSIYLSLMAAVAGLKEFGSLLVTDPVEALKHANEMRQSRMVDVVAGLGMTLLIAGVVVNYVAQLDVIQNSTGPLADEMDQVVTFIGIGFTLGALAIIAYAGRTAISFFQGGR